MYKSKIYISKDSKGVLKNQLADFLKIEENQKLYCKALKPRRVSLSKLPEALTGRHSTRRLKCFFVAVDILKNAGKDSCKSSSRGKSLHYEITGQDANGREVVVHLREEKDTKDRVLYFVSSFSRK